jgi:hypothetical protein
MGGYRRSWMHVNEIVSADCPGRHGIFAQSVEAFLGDRVLCTRVRAKKQSLIYNEWAFLEGLWL